MAAIGWRLVLYRARWGWPAMPAHGSKGAGGGSAAAEPRGGSRRRFGTISSRYRRNRAPAMRPDAVAGDCDKTNTRPTAAKAHRQCRSSSPFRCMGAAIGRSRSSRAWRDKAALDAHEQAAKAARGPAAAAVRAPFGPDAFAGARCRRPAGRAAIAAGDLCPDACRCRAAEKGRGDRAVERTRRRQPQRAGAVCASMSGSRPAGRTTARSSRSGATTRRMTRMSWPTRPAPTAPRLLPLGRARCIRRARSTSVRSLAEASAYLRRPRSSRSRPSPRAARGR